MAKVTGPLYSLGASGKIADAMVFFGWKGLNVVRQWLKPSNPMTEDQGDIRLMTGGTGRACKIVEEGSYYLNEARNFAPSGQTWISKLVSEVIKNIFVDATGYETEYAAYSSHTNKATFDSEAEGLLLTDFDISYKGTTHSYTAGFQLYMLARYATYVHGVNPTYFSKSPYTVDLASWSSSDIQAMVADLQSS